MQLLTTHRDALLAPLQSVSGIVEKRHTLPILSNVLIERQGDRLTLLATDIEVQIRTTALTEDDGVHAAVTVGAKKLQDILRALPDGCQIGLVMDNNRMTVKAGKSRFQLQTLPAADYPRITPPEDTAVRFTTTQRAFKAQLARVAYAMAQQDIRYYLNGLLLVVADQELRMVATDGHRLAFARSTLEQALPKSEVILPRKTVLELNRQLADVDEPLDVLFGSNQAVFRFGATEFITKLVDGRFPDYERVIPQQHRSLIVLERPALLSALQRAAILTTDKFRGVRLVLAQGLMKMISSNNEQEEAQEELEIDYDGPALDIGFNVTYLIDVLTNTAEDKVEWRLNDSNSSMLVTLPGNDDFKYVVMPMRI